MECELCEGDESQDQDELGGGEKYEDGEMMDLFLIMHVHSRTFCLERPERRVGQFKSEVSKVGGLTITSCTILLQTPGQAPTCLRDQVMEGGFQTQLQ